MRKFLVTNLAQDHAGRWHWTANLPALAASLPALELNPLQPDDQYHGPVLFVRGERSAYIRPADQAAIQAHFPRARMATVPGAGHNPHIDQRDAFVEAVLAAG